MGRKKFGWYEEKYGGMAAGIIISPMIFKCVSINCLVLDAGNFLSKIGDVGFIIFGFILVFTGLVIQAKHEIENQTSQMLFCRIIGYGKQVLILSGILGLIGFLGWVIIQILISKILIDILLLLSIAVVINLVHDTCNFIRVYFAVINAINSKKRQ